MHDVNYVPNNNRSEDGSFAKHFHTNTLLSHNDNTRKTICMIIRKFETLKRIYYCKHLHQTQIISKLEVHLKEWY